MPTFWIEEYIMSADLAKGPTEAKAESKANEPTQPLPKELVRDLETDRERWSEMLATVLAGQQPSHDAIGGNSRWHDLTLGSSSVLQWRSMNTTTSSFMITNTVY